jgi:hypothetical protein
VRTGPAWSRWSTLRLTDHDQPGRCIIIDPKRLDDGWCGRSKS